MHEMFNVYVCVEYCSFSFLRFKCVMCSNKVKRHFWAYKLLHLDQDLTMCPCCHCLFVVDVAAAVVVLTIQSRHLPIDWMPYIEATWMCPLM